jgi:hypothetical protein
MTAPRKSGPATLTVEFDCDRRCQAEFDLEGTPVRYTLGMMHAAVERAHDQAHTANPVRVSRHSHGAILVRTGVLAVA